MDIHVSRSAFPLKSTTCAGPEHPSFSNGQGEVRPRQTRTQVENLSITAREISGFGLSAGTHETRIGRNHQIYVNNFRAVDYKYS